MQSGKPLARVAIVATHAMQKSRSAISPFPGSEPFQPFRPYIILILRNEVTIHSRSANLKLNSRVLYRNRPTRILWSWGGLATSRARTILVLSVVSAVVSFGNAHTVSVVFVLGV